MSFAFLPRTHRISICLLQGLLFLVIILLAMLGNLLVIVSVFRTKNLRRQKAYYFVVSLALAGQEGLQGYTCFLASCYRIIFTWDIFVKVEIKERPGIVLSDYPIQSKK